MMQFCNNLTQAIDCEQLTDSILRRKAKILTSGTRSKRWPNFPESSLVVS